MFDNSDVNMGANILAGAVVYGAIMGLGQLPRGEFECAVENRQAEVTTSGVLDKDVTVTLKEKDGQAWRVVFTESAGYSGLNNDPNLPTHKAYANRFCRSGHVPELS